VEFLNNQAGKPKVSFQGNSEDCKDLDAVIFFDGSNFRLERLHRAVKSLRHVRQPGESAAALAAAAASSGGSGAVSPLHTNGGLAEKNAYKVHVVRDAYCLSCGLCCVAVCCQYPH
jgi:ELL-associated factor